MKTDAANGMIVGGGSVALTFQGYIQLAGILIGAAGVVIAFLNWRESRLRRLEDKRRSDIMDKANKLKERELDAKTKNGSKK